MFVLTVMFLPKGFAGFIMMHQTAWVRGSLKQLALPYLITGIPALLFSMSCVAMIEMSQTEEEIFHFFGMGLDPTSILTWATAMSMAAIGFYATRRSLPQLSDAWESANAIPGSKDAES